MAKPNYQYEKRQRDLAKKHKQEEKRLQKLAGKAAPEDLGQSDTECTAKIKPSNAREGEEQP